MVRYRGRKSGTSRNSSKPGAAGTGRVTGQPLGGQGAWQSPRATKEGHESFRGTPRVSPMECPPQMGTNTSHNIASESIKQTIKGKRRLDK